MATPNEAKFAEAWRALNEGMTEPGWTTLPIATSSKCVVLAGRHQPSNQESLLIGFTMSGLPKQSLPPQSKGFRLEAVELPFQGRRYFCLAITRHASASVEIFSAMLDDILVVLERTERSELEQIATVVDRIVNWQRFMSREDDGVLTNEDELGLMGELNILRLLIDLGVPLSKAIEWWQGPADSLHDFVCERGHIEVKSSLRVGPFSANVSSLDQLDESLVQPLYLAAVQFNLSSNGLRLPQLIDVVRDLLAGKPDAQMAFEGRLLSAGYHQALAARYHRQFFYLTTTLFEVKDAFPRLTKGNVLPGVVDAKYRLEIDTTKSSALSLNDVVERIG